MASTRHPHPDAEPARALKLPDAEVQALADAALTAWDSGLPQDVPDSLGGLWNFTAVRDPLAALELIRSLPDARPRDSRVSQIELGTEHARHIVAARVLALAEPVT